MIKESIFSFLKIRKVLIIIFAGIVVIFGILFYLYDIPFDAIIRSEERRVGKEC